MHLHVHESNEQQAITGLVYIDQDAGHHMMNVMQTVPCLRVGWDIDSAIGFSDRRVELAEHNRLHRYWHILLCAVVNIVHSYTNQLLWVVDWSLQCYGVM